MKNDIILFLAMLAIAWIGFNLLNERFGKKAAAVEVPAAGAAETNLSRNQLDCRYRSPCC